MHALTAYRDVIHAPERRRGSSARKRNVLDVSARTTQWSAWLSFKKCEECG